MQGFTHLHGIAASLPMANIDTDMIIPKQFLKTIHRAGLGKHLFHELRFGMDGDETPDFVLNIPPWNRAEILVTGANFGCGSSREHAPWALKDFGIRCVIAPSFADIFQSNCLQNFILPLVLPVADIEILQQDAANPANSSLRVDLQTQTVTRHTGDVIHFEFNPFRRECLLNGWDDIGLTLQHDSAITDFESQQRNSQPWLYIA